MVGENKSNNKNFSFI